MGLVSSYGMRWQRRYWHLRAAAKRRQLTPLANRTDQIGRHDLICLVTLRNERIRLPYFLDYYRAQGINHFLVVDNASDDGSRDFLMDQTDVSVWTTTASYKAAAFGVDWLNGLARRYAHGHWALTVDVDEFFVYPFCDTRPLRALTDWLDNARIRSFGAMLLDMYPKGPLEAQCYQEGQNPFEIASWFDSANYMIERNARLGNLWIQGGPRARVFFQQSPKLAPALNKTPLVRWDRRYVYTSSTHSLLPRGLNLTFDHQGGEKASGVLLHAKFLHTFAAKAQEELHRKQHYAASQEYLAYTEAKTDRTDFWCKWSERYINWRQLEILGLMSKGNWA